MRAKRKALCEALEVIASHDYAGIAIADAYLCVAREALAKFREGG